MTVFYEEKGWWKSRTVWAGLVGAVFGVLGILGIPEVIGLDAISVTNMIMSVVGVVTSILTIVYRVKANTSISSDIIPPLSE